jgi:type II secretory pathway component PulF
MVARRRIPDVVLAEVCSRLALSLSAGVDLRRAWASETARVPARNRAAMDAAGRGIAAGESLSESMRRTGGFPPGIVALVAVGERTGREAEVFGELAESLRRSHAGRRALRTALLKPAIQLALALVVVGLVASIPGLTVLSEGGATASRPGFGFGSPGVLSILAMLTAAGVAAILLGPMAARSWSDHGPIRRILRRLPVIGPPTRAAEAAEWCRAASLAASVGLDAGRLVELASAAAPTLRMSGRAVESRLRDGATLAEALRGAGRLPRPVLEAVAVGELTGSTPETLDRQAERLAEEAREGFATAVGWVGWLAWAIVAGLVATIVIRFFSFYAGLIRDAGRPI